MADLEARYFNDFESGMRLTQGIRYGVIARGIGDDLLNAEYEELGNEEYKEGG